MLRRHVRLSVLAPALATVMLGWPPGPRAQEAQTASGPEESTRLLEHLAGIDRSLQEISVLLTSVLDHQQVSVLLSRIQLKERSLAPLRDSLESARSERDGIREEMKRLRMYREEWERSQAAAAPGSPVNESEEREMRRLMAELERLEDRESVLSQRVIEMEDDLARRRDDILALEEMVDARLGLR